MLAKRMSHVTQSPTMKVAAEAERLRRQGVDIVDLGAGEPDFPTPPHIIDAGRRALDAGFTKYTTNVGVEELRAAVCDRYRTDYGVTYSPSDVIITAGGKQALYNATIALFGLGDEVVTHTPGWPTIPEQVKLADATPIIVPTQPADDFCPTADAFLKAFTPRTKGVVINSPGNPTGALMSEEDLAAVADEAAKRGIWILLDLCYERLIYDKVAHNLPGVLAARMRDRAVLCGSMSKTYAMTGWRCGWAVGPTELIKACNAIQSNATSNVNSIAQKASITALTGPQECVTEMLDEYRRRRDTLTAWLAEDTRLRVAKPAGAFYLFVDVGDILSPDGFRTSADLAQGLLDKARVALTPGEAFDAPGYIRLSYAASIERLREGATRILDFVRAHAGAVV